MSAKTVEEFWERSFEDQVRSILAEHNVIVAEEMFQLMVEIFKAGHDFLGGE